MREVVRDFAERYFRRLGRNFTLLRVLIGEFQHCDAQDHQTIREVFRPQREKFIAVLHAAQERGEIRADANLGSVSV